MAPDARLPEHLAERSRVVRDCPFSSTGEFVLYWMHHALRAHENPALDVALLLSRYLNLPLLVYQGLAERYPFASDRHHAFILQGARGAHAELAARRVAAVFHLERPGQRGPHLRTLTQRAAVVVTEEMPTQPFTGWTSRLAVSCEVPLWAVDTACVVPLRIAREAAQVGGPGAEKYLDELLIWRELAYAFCFHRKDHETTSALPSWAVRTLADCEANARPALLDWESLARGRTGDALWDAAQCCLLMRGELHNNVRMSWGKAFLRWTANAATALERMIDLNHRYALDGRDPASYGGLLWCLGQFDRPHLPPQPIFGTVRTRPTAEHAARLDPDKYLTKATRFGRTPAPRAAVIGAGVSGLIAARTLQDHGCEVAVFDKGRGLGGRATTRRADPGLSFDHGAQYFTARDPHFARYVEAWTRQGIVAEWCGRIVRIEGGDVRPTTSQLCRFVGVPGMTAIARHLAADLLPQLQTRIVRISRAGDLWELTDAAEQVHGPFDHVIVTLPAPQAAELLGTHPFAAEARAVPMTPCWAVLAAFERRIEVDWDGAFVQGKSLAWVARDSSKPGRSCSADCWVLHASPEWSAAHQDDSRESVAAALLAAFAAMTPRPVPPIHLDAHRWLFSATPLSLDRMTLFDQDTGLAVCGDWLAGGRIEGAFRSGVAAAGSILRQIGMGSARIAPTLDRTPSP